ncbi:hypothetical protein [uncultured Bacteroides sp.]|nr:hypothetical protein [uncultured Bacteroides sp.]
MKSKFFGVTAKLAIAILAVGTMFTSCYDSENGDVTKPYKAPDAVYSFIGTVTNNITGAPVSGASVALSGAVTATATTDANGVYQAVVQIDGGAEGVVTVAVAAKAGEYEAASANIDVQKMSNGQAITYYKNIVVSYTEYIPDGLKYTTSSKTDAKDVVLSGEDEEYPGLDIMNRDSEPLLVTRNFIVNEGTVVVSQNPEVYTLTKAVSAEVLDAVRNIINADLGGVAPTKEFDKKTTPFSILVAPMSALKNVTVSYLYEDKAYNFTYGSDKINVVTRRIVSVSFDYSETSFNHYHGHGHGHGHGDDLNAGGGIWE